MRVIIPFNLRFVMGRLLLYAASLFPMIGTLVLEVTLEAKYIIFLVIMLNLVNGIIQAI